ncbi:hypothetical protein [Synechococcus sp. 1G10]|uniref:hypothetical protein n=1 Tax=Synechococcus sp. 1G10 TaxID=2025605 RepID=UPI0011807145|nr:hypothetical protein [Synechococcus sp. 1G10]
MRWHSTAQRLLLATALVSGVSGGKAAASRVADCPPAGSARLDGLYRWYLAAGTSYRDDLASQQQHLCPELSVDSSASLE